MIYACTMIFSSSENAQGGKQEQWCEELIHQETEDPTRQYCFTRRRNSKVYLITITF